MIIIFMKDRATVHARVPSVSVETSNYLEKNSSYISFNTSTSFMLDKI